VDKNDENNRPLIEVKELTKSYFRANLETLVLRGISCDIAEGSFAFVVGPSGSGKSTLLYLLGGLDQPSSGHISIAGQQLMEMSPRELDTLRRTKIGFIFQSFNLLRTMNCIDNVLAPFIPTGQAAVKREEAEELLARVGLGDRMHHRPSELSGGEQQRVAIARAILKKPQVILADEPTGELDTETGRRVFDILRDLNQIEGTTIITVTHDERYINPDDKVLRMQDGQFLTK
jgi:putative ABC transport system ATP-binding protein